jgi:signal transduction histidine kinase
LTAIAALDLVVGIVLVTSGGVAWRQRPESRIGVLLVLTGAAWFAGYLTSGLAFLHRGPLTQVHLSYPTGRLRGWLPSCTVALAYAVAVTDAFAASPWLQVGLAGLVATSALRVFGAARGTARVAARPALLAALAFAAALVLGGVNTVGAWRLDTTVSIVYDLIVGIVAIVLVSDLLRGAWTDDAVADLVTNITQDAQPGLQSELRRALDDPGLHIGYWNAARNAYLDGTGADVPNPGSESDQAVTVIDDHGPLAKVVHDAELVRDPAWEQVLTVLRLAIRNSRMHAEIDAAIAQLRESRRRILESGDDQRRQMVDALTAGPFAQLAAADAQIRACTDLNGERDEILSELDAVRAELEALVNGIRPAVLVEGGLAASLPTLAARSAVPVDLTVCTPRLPAETETAIYFCCAEALTNTGRHARATTARVEVTTDSGVVRLVVEDDGVGGAGHTRSGLRGLADRVEALGGTFDLASPHGGGTRLTVLIPYAWGQST